MSTGSGSTRLWKFIQPAIQLVGAIPNLWNQFWFESNHAFAFDRFRRVFALVLLACYSVRTFDLNLFYSNSGILPLSSVPEATYMEGRYSILFFFTSDAALWFFHFLFLFSLAVMVVGPTRKRISATTVKVFSVLALILHISFLHRMIVIAYGVDLISVFFLAYLCLGDFRKNSIHQDANGLSVAGTDWQSLLGSVAYRLVQLQLCIIYAFSGCEKLKGTHWWRGEAVWDMMANAQIARIDATWLAHYPALITLMTFTALIWEIYFPVLVWVKTLRPYVLLVGLAMHAMIMITIDIPYFSLMMMTPYLLFMDRKTLVQLTQTANKASYTKKV
jgi:hypothetical protein